METKKFINEKEKYVKTVLIKKNALFIASKYIGGRIVKMISGYAIYCKVPTE